MEHPLGTHNLQSLVVTIDRETTEIDLQCSYMKQVKKLCLWWCVGGSGVCILVVVAVFELP